MSYYLPSSARITRPMAIALIVLGILAIALPLVSGLAIAYVCSVAIAIAGIVHLGLAFRHQHARSRLWHVLAGLVLLAGGLLLGAMPLDTMASFTLIVAWLFILAGLMRIAGWFAVRHVRGAVWMLLDGAVSTVIGVALIASWPGSSLWTIGTLVGVNLIFSGFSALQAAPQGKSR